MSIRTDASVQERVIDLAEEVVQAASEAVRAGRDYLGSPEGRDLRNRVANSVIWAAPLIGEIPVIRTTAAGRFLRYAGVTAILIKGAEWLRDWDPATA
jgi:hypothetical protein